MDLIVYIWLIVLTCILIYQHFATFVKVRNIAGYCVTAIMEICEAAGLDASKVLSRASELFLEGKK